MRSKLFLVVLALLLPLPLAALAAGEEDARLGEAWESGIALGIARQRQELDRGVTPQSILRQAELQAARRSDDVTQVVRLYLLARAYAKVGDRRSAISTYQEVLRLAPRCYFVHRDLAILALEQQPPDSRVAEAYLRQAISTHPQYLTAHRNLAKLMFDDGRILDAIPVLERVVALAPADLQARYLLAKALLQDAQQETGPAKEAKLEKAERAIAVLIRKEPKTPSFRELKGDIFLARGRTVEALKEYRRLAAEHPGAAQPLRKYLFALDVQRQRDETVDREAWLWALEGLFRLTRDPEERSRLQRAIDELRSPTSSGDAQMPEGPPTDETILVALANAPAEVRVRILQYVYGREETPSPEVLKELLVRLSPTSEPEAEARQWVLRGLGRFGGPGVVPWVRLSLSDASADVRAAAADALFALAPTGKQAEGAVFLILGLYRSHADAALAASARARVLDLAQVSATVGDDADYGAEREAFLTWWSGPDASEAKIEALEFFPGVRDMFPEDVLLPYLVDDDGYVADAAWQALGTSLTPLLTDPKVSAGRKAWFGQLPPYRKGALSGPEAQVTRDRLEAWAARKPNG